MKPWLATLDIFLILAEYYGWKAAIQIHLLKITLSGSYKHPPSHEKLPFKNCIFQSNSIN
jgi:hypothetical protein